MSLLHRNLIAAIVAGLEPVVESAVRVFVPGGAAAGALINAGAQAVENIADEVGGGDDEPAPAAAVVTVAGASIVSPFPAAAPAAPAPVAAALPAPVQTSGLSPAAAPAPAAAGAALSAADVIAALMQTLQALSARL